MKLALRLLFCTAVATACGNRHAGATDFEHADVGLPSQDIAARLAAIPGVTVAEQSTRLFEYRSFVVHVTQLVDHGKPDGQLFQQELTLLHRDLTSPMVFETTGYDDYFGDHLSEPAAALGANQVSIEHRYFGGSVPMPADWALLDIEQMAADEHEIVTLFKRIYPVKTLATGASKGGMTAVFFARFHPGDVDGTVAYVAPLSFGVDARYVSYLDALGTAECRQALRALAIEMLQNRRGALISRAQADAVSGHYVYTRVQIGPAVESAVASLEWSFWQYIGVFACDEVPAVTASDDDLWNFLEFASPVEDGDDDAIARFAPYYFQASTELGTPDSETYLNQYLQYGDAAYADAWPVQPVPPLDPRPMQDIDEWVQSQGNRLLFVYGQWDPWSGGMFRLGNATDSAIFIKPQGTHQSQIRTLASGDRDSALAMLTAWTGVPASASLEPEPQPRLIRRLPPALLRGLRR